MAAFVALIVLFGVFHLPGIGSLDCLKTGRDKAALAGGLTFLGLGLHQAANAKAFAAMLPDLFPERETLMLASGGAMALCALGLLFPATRRIAGILLALVLIGLVPAHFNAAFSGAGEVSGEDWERWVRLGVQLVFVVWAIWCASEPRHRVRASDYGLEEWAK
jgi:uncharacterized membrane protein